MSLTEQAAALLCWSCSGSGTEMDICGCCEVQCEECSGTGLRCSEPPVYVPEPPKTPEQIAADHAAYEERLAAMPPMQRAALEAMRYMQQQLYAPLTLDRPIRWFGSNALIVENADAKGTFIFDALIENAVPPDGVLSGAAPEPSDLFWYRQHDLEARRALRDAGVIPWMPPLTGEALLEEQLVDRLGRKT